MIPVWLLLLLGAGAAAVVVMYWDEIIEWVTEVVHKLRDWFVRNFPTITHYVKVFVEKIRDAIATVKCKAYYEKEDGWYLKEGERKISESEVPADILAKAKRLKKGQEADITEEMKLEQTA